MENKLSQLKQTKMNSLLLQMCSNYLDTQLRVLPLRKS